MAVTPRRVTDRVIARIRSSEYSMRIVFPLVRQKPTGTAAIPLPVSPLVMKPNPQPVQEEELERIQSDVTVKCLYLEVTAMSDMRTPRLEALVSSWSRDVSGYARVIASDIDRPGGGGTILDGCDHVEIAGSRYKVLSVVRASASMVASGTYYVVLAGATKS